MTHYQSLASQLQSRIARRANVITSTIQWKEVHKAMQQMKDYRETKATLIELHDQQVLDKKLLRMAQGMGYMDELMAE